ncbi:MAG: oligosaccharide flippase family protein [Magnetococcales bacterium]|nr:oligosaccharide flippase family protein [Magnetococcales bacterium]
MSENSLVSRLARYAAGQLFQRIIRLANAYIKPRFLDPVQIGLWNGLNLIPTYAAFSHLGALQTLRLRIPELLAEGREEERLRLQTTAYWGTLYPSLLIALGAFLAGLFPTLEEIIRHGLWTMAIAVLMGWYTQYQLTLCKGEQLFEIITRSNYIGSWSTLLLGLPAIVLLGMEGVYLSFLASQLLTLLYLRRVHPLHHRGGPSRSLFFSLVKEGWPLLLFGIALTLITTLDRFIILAKLGTEALGFYALALTASGFLLQIPMATREILEPQLMAMLAKHPPTRIWDEHYYRPLINTAFYYPLIAAPVIFLAEPVLALILPKFTPSATSAAILAAGSWFLALSFVSRGMLGALRLQLRALPILFAALLCHASLSLFLIDRGLGIEGVALSASLAFALLFLGLTFFLGRRTPFNRREEARRLLAIGVAPLVTLPAIPLAKGYLASPWLQAALYTAGLVLLIQISSRFSPLLKPLRQPARKNLP